MTRRAAMWIATTALATVLSGVAVNQVLDNGKLHWTWLIAAIVVSVASSVAALRMTSPATETPAAIDPAAAEQSLAMLAAAVEAVWKPEQSRRRLLNPRPLPTPWVSIGPPVADHWANIRADGVD